MHPVLLVMNYNKHEAVRVFVNMLNVILTDFEI